MALVASFAPSLRSGANDASRATNKQYALQKSSYCPISAVRHFEVLERDPDTLREQSGGRLRDLAQIQGL